MLGLGTLFLMILNGIIFIPPSEALYYYVFVSGGKNMSIQYMLLPIFNAIGHIVLFVLIRRRKKLQENQLVYKIFNNFYIKKSLKLVQKTEEQSKVYFNKYGNKYYSVIIGRCVPFVHTGISIPAALSDITFRKYAIFTIIGNIIFSLLCFLIFALVPKEYDPISSLSIVLSVFFILYGIHLYDFYKKTKKGQS